MRLAVGLAATLIGVVLAVVAFSFVSRSSPIIAPLARLETADVHSLAFVGDDARHLVFGHHGGVLETVDGGRTWTSLAAREDAMGMSAATGGSVVIAGHDVFSVSLDGGRTWASVTTDLPNRDIHGLTRDPADPGHMWAALATGGLWESRDGGLHFEQVYRENVLLPVAMNGPRGPRLVAVAATGLVDSDDGGRSWIAIGDPGLYPIVSLAAIHDGTVLIAGGPDGLRRSDDGGRTWKNPGFPGDPFAVAISGTGRTVALVTRKGEFFRSDDGGTTWAAP
jgi:photosystem II stability/assembly factor-like uncharacterized protein